MTPKEKAEELVKSFKSYSYYNAHNLTSRFRKEQSNLESAIEYALIAVDEIMKNEYETVKKLLKTIESNDTKLIISFNKDYWQEVKQEIKKL